MKVGLQQSASVAYLILLSILSIIASISAHEHSAATEPGFLFKEDFHSAKLALPFTLNIGLLGLEGNGENSVELAPSVLQDILTRSYSTHIPSAIDTASHLNVAFDIKYGVHHVAHFSITQIESLLSRSMQHMETVEDCMMYEIDFAEVESWIDRIYTDGLAQVAGTSGIDRYTHSENDEHIANQKPSVIVIAPSKFRMRPTLPPDALNATQYAYYYRYHRSAPTQVIIGSLRYVFVDLSAGPVPLIDSEARNDVHELTASDIVPRPQRIDIDELTELQLRSASGRSTIIPPSRSSTLMVAELMTVIVNSIKCVFLPDMYYRSLPYVETIVVPIIVLRNHHLFDPWRQEGGEETLLSGAEGPVNDFKIDLHAIKQQIEPLLLATSTRVIFTHALHSLDNFPMLGAALNSSIREDTLYRFSIQRGELEPYRVQYIKSEQLLQSTLSALTDETLADMGNYGEHRGKHRRIFPVFVYSLMGYPAELLINRKGLHGNNKNAAVVLQTDANAISTRYQSQDGVLTINSQRSTLPIIAALMTSLCSITPSNIYMDRNLRIVHSYLFSIGAHPFPPFATEQSIVALSSSLLYRDVAIRNIVIMRVTSGLRSVYRIVKSLDRAIDHFGSHLIGFDNEDGALFTLWKQKKLRTGLSISSEDTDELQDEFESFLTQSVNSLLGLERTYRRVIEHIQDPYSSAGFEFDMLHQLTSLAVTESQRLEQSVEASIRSFNDTYSDCTFTWAIDKESPEVEQQRTSVFTVTLWICTLSGLVALAYIVGKRLCLFDSEYGSRSLAWSIRSRVAVWSRSVPGRNKKLHGV